MKVSLDLRLARLPGGGRSYTQRLVPTLARLYQNVRWRYYYNPDCAAQRKILRRMETNDSSDAPGGHFESVKVKARTLSLRQHVSFLRYRDDADLYHYLHFDAPLGMRGVPLALSILDLYPLTVSGYCSRAKRSYFYRLTRRNAQRAARIITISQHSKNDIVERLGVPEEKVTVTPLSHAREYRPIDDGKLLEGTAKKYRLPERFIFYAGNHKPHKNLDRLIQAYAAMPRRQRESYRLVLTGAASPETAALLEKATVLGVDGSLRFAGWVDQKDLPGLYNLASLAVLPSLYEGFGLGPLEAMACGTPVACSNAAAIPEVVGQAGRTFDPCSVEQMSATLQAALEKDVDNPEVRKKCLQQASGFSEERTARLTYEVYECIGR